VKKRPTCIGVGLVALDVILNGSPQTLPKISAGGSCGNVLAILSYLGWKSFPIARLANNDATKELLTDFTRWDISSKFLLINDEGSTPIIIHRILRNAKGQPIHRFEFRDPDTKEWLPRFKPITINIAREIISENENAEVFYFDRINPGTIELAKYYKTNGAIIFFEPSSIKDDRIFEECITISNIIKFSNERIPNFRNRFPHIVADLEIETLGKQGLAYRSKKRANKDEWKVMSSFPIENVIDSAGAGDWCSAGIISKLCNTGYSGFKQNNLTEIESALNYGQILGSINCCFDGARGIMYTLSKKELDEFIMKMFNTKTIENICCSLSEYKKYNIDISRKVEFSSLY
jgi:sugar/nucleoside kinase (ribokinase family)